MTVRAALLLAAALAAAAGCRPVARERSDIHAAPARVHRSPRVAREMEHEEVSWRRVVEDMDRAAEAAERQHDELVAAVGRERGQYRRLLSKDLAWVDQKVAELEQDAARAEPASRDGKQRDVAAARAWRATLDADLRAIDGADEDDWTSLKDRIERDLDDNRPLVIPRSYEKSYGI